MTGAFSTMTWTQLFVELCKLGYQLGKHVFLIIWFLISTLFRFAFYLMTPEEHDEAETASHANGHLPHER